MTGGTGAMDTIHSKPYRRRRLGTEQAVCARLLGPADEDRLEQASLRLAQALRQEVTQRQRQMLALYYGQNMTMEDIGRTLGVDRTTVSRTIKRGEARLRRCLRYGSPALLDWAAAEEKFCRSIDKGRAGGR